TLPARHRVVYVPFTDRPLAFCRFAVVSALPSRIEGLSIALLETMALGLPVVASDAGGNPDLITPGDTGVLVAPLDPVAWAQALAQVLGDREVAGRIARQRRQRSALSPDDRPCAHRRQAAAYPERGVPVDLARRVARSPDATGVRLVRRDQTGRLPGGVAARAARPAVRRRRARRGPLAARSEDPALGVQALDRAPHARAVLGGRRQQPLDG